MQRSQKSALCQALVSLPSLDKRLFGKYFGKGIEFGIDGLNAVQVGADNFFGRNIFGPDGLRQFGG